MKSYDAMVLDIMLSDPWDFVTDHGSGPFRCYWVATEYSESDCPSGADCDHSRKGYARLAEPMLIDGLKCEYVQILRHFARGSVHDVFKGVMVPAGFIFAPTLEEAHEPWNPSQAPRAATGSLSLHKDEGNIP